MNLLALTLNPGLVVEHHPRNLPLPRGFQFGVNARTWKGRVAAKRTLIWCRETKHRVLICLRVLNFVGF